jgi:hypothetical protein
MSASRLAGEAGGKAEGGSVRSQPSLRLHKPTTQKGRR